MKYNLTASLEEWHTINATEAGWSYGGQLHRQLEGSIGQRVVVLRESFLTQLSEARGLGADWRRNMRAILRSKRRLTKKHQPTRWEVVLVVIQCGPDEYRFEAYELPSVPPGTLWNMMQVTRLPTITDCDGNVEFPTERVQ